MGPGPKIQEFSEHITARQECENKAQQVVEALLEQENDPVETLSMMRFINPSRYDDVVAERNISELCGYCLCSKTLPSMPNKLYHISLPETKIYELKERKKFCSTRCFKASNYLRAQIPTSPLWLRKGDPAYNFKLYKPPAHIDTNPA